MLLALLVVGCKSDETNDSFEITLPITLNEEVSLSALSGEDGTTFSFNVDIEGDWSASIVKGSSWGSLAVESRSGDAVSGLTEVSYSGPALVRVTLESNIDRSEREGTLAFETISGIDYIYYTQKSYYSSSVENAELLRLVMGETSSDLVVASMPYEGLGINSVTFTSSGTTTLGTTSAYRSSSVEGLYTASGKAYLSLGAAGIFTINNLSFVSTGDLRLQFGARQLGVDEFSTESFAIEYVIKSEIDEIVEGWTTVDYTYCGDGSGWSLAYADIPYTSGSYIDITIFTSSELEGFDTLIDDISVYQERIEVTSSLTANVTKKYYDYVDVSADLIEIPEGTAVEDSMVSQYYFLWSDEDGYSDGDSTNWTKLVATDTPYAYAEGVFSARIEGLTGATTYYMRAVVELADGSELYSVIREFETYDAPQTTITSTIPTNETILVVAAITYDDEMEASIDERGFYYRLASEDVSSNIPVVLAADDEFAAVIGGLTPELEYILQSYCVIDDVTFKSEEKSVFALPDPLDLYTDSVFWSGSIQYGEESTFVITLPHNDLLESGDVVFNVLTELGEGDIPVPPTGVDIEDVGQGGSTLGDDTDVDDGFADLYIVETLNGANTTGVPGYKYASTFAVVGTPVAEGYYSVPIEFSRKDVAISTVYKVAIYDVDGKLTLASLTLNEYSTQEGWNATESTGSAANPLIYRTSFEFYELNESGYKDNGYYGLNPSQFYYYPTIYRDSDSYTTYNNTAGFRWWMQSPYGFSVDGIYKISDVENPTESVRYDIPLPLGMRDLADYECVASTRLRYIKSDTYSGWRSMFSQDNGSSWMKVSDYYISKALTGALDRTVGYDASSTCISHTSTVNRQFFPAYSGFASQTAGSLQIRYSSEVSDQELASNNRYGMYSLCVELYPKSVE